MNLHEEILESFDEKFPISIDYPPITEMEVFTQMEIDRRHKRALAQHEEFESFLLSALKRYGEAMVGEIEKRRIRPLENRYISDESHGYNNALRDTQESLRSKYIQPIK